SAERRGWQSYAPVEESAFHRVLRAKTNVQAETPSRSAIVRISSSPRSGRGAARRLSLGILGQIGRERTIFLRLKSREPLRQSLLDRREGVVAEHDPLRRRVLSAGRPDTTALGAARRTAMADASVNCLLLLAYCGCGSWHVRANKATIASRRYSSETISARPFCCHSSQRVQSAHGSGLPPWIRWRR